MLKYFLTIGQMSKEPIEHKGCGMFDFKSVSLIKWCQQENAPIYPQSRFILQWYMHYRVTCDIQNQFGFVKQK